MKKRHERCEECNGNIMYDKDVGEHRCSHCGLITEEDGSVLYDVQTLLDM